MTRIGRIAGAGDEDRMRAGFGAQGHAAEMDVVAVDMQGGGPGGHFGDEQRSDKQRGHKGAKFSCEDSSHSVGRGRVCAGLRRTIPLRCKT